MNTDSVQSFKVNLTSSVLLSGWVPGAGGQASTEKCSWHDDVSIQGVWRGSKGDNDLGVGEEKEWVGEIS